VPDLGVEGGWSSGSYLLLMSCTRRSAMLGWVRAAAMALAVTALGGHP
jgi:hypothetical protein